MKQPCQFSNVTQNYLAEFHCILEDMIREMTEAPLTDSISWNFIVQMLPHHRAAIRMSHSILQYTTNIPLQTIASNIITEQTKSIDNMKTIQCLCEQLVNSEEDVYLYQNRVSRILQTMFSGMKNASASNSVNCSFMWEMIPHHKGAVEMSENALQYPICPELKPILYAIITSQKKGIAQMRQLLRCIGCCRF